MDEEKRTRPLERFGWFAVSHVLISILTLMLFIVLLGISSIINNAWIFLLILLELLSMAAYWGMGACLARGWTAFSGPKEFWGTMLRPAVIAWIWGGVVLAIYIGGVWLPEDTIIPMAAVWGTAVGILFWATLVFAAPSSLMAMLWFLAGIAQTWPSWSLAVMLLLAGGLPPLLFTLGSAWESAPKETRSKGPLLTGSALVVVLGLFFSIGGNAAG